MHYVKAPCLCVWNVLQTCLAFLGVMREPSSLSTLLLLTLSTEKLSKGDAEGRNVLVWCDFHPRSFHPLQWLTAVTLLPYWHCDSLRIFLWTDKLKDLLCWAQLLILTLKIEANKFKSRPTNTLGLDLSTVLHGLNQQMEFTINCHETTDVQTLIL